MKQIAGSIAYITGGSSGIGLAIARELRRLGASLVLIARDRQRLDNARNELLLTGAAAARDGAVAAVEILSLDVSDEARVATELAAAVQRHGGPDILVNCAGIVEPGYFSRLESAQRNRQMQVNFYAAWDIIHALLPELRRRGGRIVNVASLAGLVGYFGYTAYAASKFALVGFSEALRSELAPDGVSVSVLCPPDTDTPQLRYENGVKPPEAAAIARGAGLMQPQAVARACVRGMLRRRFLIVPGAQARLSYAIKRLIPGLLYRLMDGMVLQSRRRVESSVEPSNV